MKIYVWAILSGIIMTNGHNNDNVPDGEPDQVWAQNVPIYRMQC